MVNQTLLLAVTGLSPQVVTETLYAIAQQQLEWPDRILILTTKRGKQEARLGLLVSGQLAALCQEVQRPMPVFDEQDILVIPDAAGNAVDDARTLEDQEALADFITAQVASLSENLSQRIHASIAGGRKTMTFYLGYAMTLFGRPFDRLSHVLVSEPYESIPDFYFPTRQSKRIVARDGRQLDARDAEVTLAEIPFISQRSMVSSALLQQFSRVSYVELIRLLQLAQQPGQLQLRFCHHRHQPQVWLNDVCLDFSKRKLEFAFWAMVARPRGADEDVSIERPVDELSKALVTKLYLAELAEMAGLALNSRQLGHSLELLYDHDLLEQKTLEALQSNEGMNGSFFDTRRTNLKEFLHSQLPSALTEVLMPAIIQRPDGSKLQFGQSSQRGSYGMWLAPEQIQMQQMVDTSKED
ncbi:TIGR02584 family CRISPR-associated protein [Rheinheimera sediminis]|uniref:CRISPR-associated ring nuclease Csm6 n=1 Tax=Rheinheimera sp. YQF-1 TaxID=2499626 RepID=UPI000FD8D870|nr:CRISPR-associated ring nuclease Csm6 [Rheinheimera sp. YQF-1]RVT47837.1 TIGR02584 family CRISPR-associated protein [Rheinheimera sp. YQF-1]